MQTVFSAVENLQENILRSKPTTATLYWRFLFIIQKKLKRRYKIRVLIFFSEEEGLIITM